MTKFELIIDQRYLDIRNRAATTYKGSDLFRGTCELPEYHQCEVDPNQTLFESKHDNGYREADTVHKELGNLDYKIDSKEGVYLSESTEKNIKAGNINGILVWSWIDWPNPALKVGDKLSYVIKGWIDGNEALKLMDKSTRRVKYTKLNVL